MVQTETSNSQTITSEPDNVTTAGFSCPYLLPCGYCRELERQCPKQYGTTIRWQEPYCGNQSELANSGVYFVNCQTADKSMSYCEGKPFQSKE